MILIAKEIEGWREKFDLSTGMEVRAPYPGKRADNPYEVLHLRDNLLAMASFGGVGELSNHFGTTDAELVEGHSQYAMTCGSGRYDCG